MSLCILLWIVFEDESINLSYKSADTPCSKPVTFAPASDAITLPAAMSHGLRLNS